MTPILSVNKLSIAYDDSFALENISFDIPAGDMLAIIGPNGAGKSTLLKVIMGLLKIPPKSEIRVDPKRLGYVPQHQDVDWSFPVTVRDVVMMGLVKEIGWLRFPQSKHWQAVDFALERVAMNDFGARQIGELSGGQRQRVFIARALVQESDILLLDEPFAGVDIGVETDLMKTITALNKEGITILLTTHDLGLAFKRFKRVMALNRELIGIGTPQEMYTAEMLRALYGGSVATVNEAGQVMVFVDDDVHCC
jgi:ABC-type Mn2+/Zn2+ transport system ATPase subunit